MSQFEVLMKRYQGMVYSQAKKAFFTDEEAEDFTQEVFLQTYESLSKFRGESQFSTWLFQIARFRLTKVYKRKNYLLQTGKKTSLSLLIKREHRLLTS